MDNDMRIMKFEILVDRIRDCVGWCWKDRDADSLCGKPYHLWKRGDYRTFQGHLAAIFDYGSLNNYGKIIMKQAKEEKLGEYKDIHKKVDVIQGINGWSFSDMERPKYKIRFVFWAMMILTVEDTDKEERLSLVCDLARMLEISDEDVMDILQVIQVIYHKNEEGVKFHSEYTEEVFQKLMEAWDVPILESKLRNKVGKEIKG